MERQFYTSGEFAKRAQVTLRTIRYYDKVNLLHPSKVTESGARLYTDADLAKLQQILLYKYLGFSLGEIREMTLAAQDQEYLVSSLQIQKKLVQERMQELRQMVDAINQMTEQIEQDKEIDWNRMLHLIHMSTMERSLKTQYINAANISARIKLHEEYSVNPEGWFPWMMAQKPLDEGENVLEVGSGNGEFWKLNQDKIPKYCHITVTDLSAGMIRDSKMKIKDDDRFQYTVMNCEKLKYPDASFDRVYANHVLFYCDIDKTLGEIQRVLKNGGVLICSTYGRDHMKEITELVQDFNKDIVLSGHQLYEKFGLENGETILHKYFKHVECRKYEDEIQIDTPEPLISYILSCHGNQNRVLIDKYKDFKEFVVDRVKGGFHITKDAGIFICNK